MDASRARAPRVDQGAVSETLIIKTEPEYEWETENSDEKYEFSEFAGQDETSRDKSNEGCTDQFDADQLEERRTQVDDFFTPDVLINYPHTSKLWSESSTRLFLTMYKKLKGMYDKGESNLKHRQRFGIIAENLRKRGFNYTKAQVESRFKSLKRSYQKKAMQEELFLKQGKTKPNHPSSQYHLYANDMHELFKDCVSEIRESVTNDKEMGGKKKKRKLVEISTEEHIQSDGDISESRSEGFHNGLSSFVEQLKTEIPETITCTTDSGKVIELEDAASPIHVPDTKEVHVGDAVEAIQLLRKDYNAWQKIREEGKDRRHQEKMKLYSQLIQVMASRK